MLESWKLSQAVVSALAAESWTPAVSAIQAAWSVPYEPEQLQGIQVLVSPDSVQQLEQIDRARRVSQRVTASLLIQQKLPTSGMADVIASLADLQTRMLDFLRTSPPLILEGLEFHYDAQAASGFVREHLEEYRVYTGYLDLQYVMWR